MSRRNFLIWTDDVEVKGGTRGGGVKVDPDKGTVTTSIEDNPDDDATD
jgi:hypothetical protein